MKNRFLWALIGPFLFLGNIHASENLQSLIADARLLVLDSTSTPRQRFSDSQVTEFLNQGQRNATANGSCLQNSITFQLLQGTTYYALPSNFSTILRVTIGSKYIPQQSVAGLDGKSRGWEAASGYPTYYFVDFSTRGAIGFAPFPLQATDVDTVKVEYEMQAADLVNSTDLPFNGVSELQEYDHMLAYYAGSIMASVDGQTAMATNYMSIYMDRYKNFKEDCNNMPAYLPSAAGSN